MALNSSRDIFVGTLGGLFHSRNAGENWYSCMKTGLPGDLITALLVDNHDALYVGTDNNGIYLSKDNYNHWEPLNCGLANPRIEAFAINSDGYIFVGTHGSGVFVSRQSTAPVENKLINTSLSFLLNQNYPNPFNLSTTIRYQLPQVTKVEIYICNLIGARVKTLVNVIEHAGYHEVLWNSTDDANQLVPSGIYLIKMIAGDYDKTLKMSLIK